MTKNQHQQPIKPATKSTVRQKMIRHCLLIGFLAASLSPVLEAAEARQEVVPIDINEEGKLLNGRHRLIACCAVGIQLVFRSVDPKNALQHVLADASQRIYNTATRAWMALGVEKVLKARCGKLLEQSECQAND